MKQTSASNAAQSKRPHSTGRIGSLSALGFFVVFAATAYSGANIVAFERLEGWAGNVTGQPNDAVLGPVSTWKNTTGVATRARSLALNIVLADTPGDTAAVQNALDGIVKASPTSVAAWQASAEYQRALRAPIERVLAAFRMSALTGSHEGYFMMQRAIFGLEQWPELSEADRRIVMQDVRGTALHWDFGRRGERYRAILREKSEAERDDIRTALTASGLATKDVLQALGM